MARVGSSGELRPRRKVSLLMHTATDWTRQILKGVATYAHEIGLWDCCLEPRGYYEKLSLPRGWNGDGVITRLTHPGIEKTVFDHKIPCVNVSWLGEHCERIPKVNSDEKACAQLGAEHLAARGVKSFGFISPAKELGYRNDALSSFEQYAESHSFGFSEFVLKNVKYQTAMTEQRARMKRWVAEIPKPVGILVWDSHVGRELSIVCKALELSVPNDVAIICIEHDHLASSLAPIPLSCIDQDPMRVGFEAAMVLDQMMSGQAPPKAPIIVPPVGVIDRESTQVNFVNDDLVSEALAYVNEHLTEPLQVVDLQKQFSVSRRQLEVRFKEAIGRSPGAEIRRSRLARVKRLLIETELSMAKVAERCGFEHTEVMMRAFKREFKITPGGFRRLH